MEEAGVKDRNTAWIKEEGAGSQYRHLLPLNPSPPPPWVLLAPTAPEITMTNGAIFTAAAAAARKRKKRRKWKRME